MRPAAAAALATLLALNAVVLVTGRALAPSLLLPANASAAGPGGGDRVGSAAERGTPSSRGGSLPFSPAFAPPPVANDRPLIGILTQACHRCPGRSYIAAAYVKWVESAGGRAVPIRFYSSPQELRRLFESVNGLVFPGGLTDIYPRDPYTVAARTLYGWAKEANDAGTPFPIWGTCLGFQLFAVLETDAHFEDLLIPTDAVSFPSPLAFTPAARGSRLFGRLFEERPALAAALEDPAAAVAMENHEFGLPLSAVDPGSTPWPALVAAFDVLSTATDRQGVQYVSTIEAKQYPFYGTQWHPEKPPFEFSDRTIPKSHAAMSVSHYLADLFMDAARACPHAPTSPEQELADLIYNAKPVFTAREAVMEASYDGPDITYFFDKDNAPKEQPAKA